MRILVTNDDGIHSPGLWSVAEALKPLGEVIVVAPDRDQSGISAAMTLLAVVRAEEVPAQIEGVKAFSVEGTATSGAFHPSPYRWRRLLTSASMWLPRRPDG